MSPLRLSDRGTRLYIKRSAGRLSDTNTLSEWPADTYISREATLLQSLFLSPVGLGVIEESRLVCLFADMGFSVAVPGSHLGVGRHSGSEHVRRPLPLPTSALAGAQQYRDYYKENIEKILHEMSLESQGAPFGLLGNLLLAYPP